MNYFDILLAKKLEDDRDPKVEGLSVTENGRYHEDGVVYDPVIVEVPEPTLISKSITANGNYSASADNADGYSSVSVNVPLPSNAYLLKSIENVNIATFTDGTDNFLKSLKVAIEPQQEGSGDPSPENVRPISGHTEANIVVSPTTDAEDGTTYNIQFRDGDNPLTVYGGSLDVVSGELTVDRVSVTVDENSNINSVSGGFPFGINLLTGAKASSSESALTGVKCNLLKEVTQSSSWGVNGTFSRVISPVENVYFKVNSEITTIQQLKTFLQSNNLQFVYELATPLTIQLTPTVVKSLRGMNNVFADSGNILDLSYLAKEE